MSPAERHDPNLSDLSLGGAGRPAPREGGDSDGDGDGDGAPEVVGIDQGVVVGDRTSGDGVDDAVMVDGPVDEVLAEEEYEDFEVRAELAEERREGVGPKQPGASVGSTAAKRRSTSSGADASGSPSRPSSSWPAWCRSGFGASTSASTSRVAPRGPSWRPGSPRPRRRRRSRRPG